MAVYWMQVISPSIKSCEAPGTRNNVEEFGFEKEIKKANIWTRLNLDPVYEVYGTYRNIYTKEIWHTESELEGTECV